ncbi:MAG TPA: NAD-dependent epimerase/dehydratase family protein [Actinomycetota bacterium]|nr:NAD-dependent epimerase/dehydratase family protein [Actinomycetota bacterium]
MNVLVTGGAGFIGSHLVEALVARGDTVTVLDDLRGGTIANLDAVAGDVHFEEGDLLGADLPALLAGGGFDTVFHLAGTAYVPPSVEDPVYDFRLVAEGTLKVCDALRRHSPSSTLVYTSSAAVYGDPESLPITEDHRVAPVSPYGLHKYTAEQSVRLHAELYGLRTASARLFSVYGPRQRKQVIFDFARKIAASPSRIEAFGDGTQVRDFVYVGDVVRALLRIASGGPLRGEVYNVATGRGISTGELLAMVAATMNAEPEVVWSGSVRPGDPDKWLASIERLRSIGYEPATSLEDGIAATVAWARELIQA